MLAAVVPAQRAEGSKRSLQVRLNGRITVVCQCQCPKGAEVQRLENATNIKLRED